MEVRNKNKIILSESELRRLISDAVRDAINELKHPIVEMARVGYIGKKNDYEVYIHTNDMGNIPHFHLRDSATQGEDFETCVQLKDNKYFLHGRYVSVMNSSLRNSLANFMESESKVVKGKTNYEIAVEAWNLNNSSENVELLYNEDGNVIIPNYREIN